MIPPCWPFAV
jgi:hypothetical protein